MFVRLTFGLLCCVLMLAPNPAAAFQDFGLSFTSGVTGDGFDYPFSIGPSTATDIGITVEDFVTPISPTLNLVTAVSTLVIRSILHLQISISPEIFSSAVLVRLQHH